MTTKEFVQYLVRHCSNKEFNGLDFGLDLWIKYDVGRCRFLVSGELFPPTYISRKELERSLDTIGGLTDLIRDKDKKEAKRHERCA